MDVVHLRDLHYHGSYTLLHMSCRHTHTHTHTHTQMRTNAHTHTHTHCRAHTLSWKLHSLTHELSKHTHTHCRAHTHMLFRCIECLLKYGSIFTSVYITGLSCCVSRVTSKPTKAGFSLSLTDFSVELSPMCLSNTLGWPGFVLATS